MRSSWASLTGAVHFEPTDRPNGLREKQLYELFVVRTVLVSAACCCLDVCHARMCCARGMSTRIVLGARNIGL